MGYNILHLRLHGTLLRHILVRKYFFIGRARGTCLSQHTPAATHQGIVVLVLCTS